MKELYRISFRLLCLVVLVTCAVCAVQAAGPSIFSAVASGDLDQVKQMVEADVGLVNASTGMTAETPLHIAASNGHKDIAEYLLSKGADINARAKFVEGATPLYNAASNGHKGVVKLLLSKGADTSLAARPGRQEETAYDAVSFQYDRTRDEKYKEIMDLLLKNAAQTDPQQLTVAALIELITKNEVEAATKLIESRPELVTQKIPVDGYTPLHVAAGQGSVDLVKLLIAKGAGIKEQDRNGATPLHHAAERGKTQAAEILIVKGAVVDAKASGGETPLFLAVVKKQSPIVKLLVAKGADVNTVYGAGTMLHAVALAGTADMAELLISKGAKVNAKSKTNSVTPLHIAAASNNLAVAKVLIVKGADVNARDKEDDTPLYYAERKGSKEIADLLSKHGAVKD